MTFLQGVGVSLMLVQGLTGVYSIVITSWMFVYFRDSFITIHQVSIIIITRPKPAYGRQGLTGVSLRASGAQLGRIGSDHFS